MALALLVREHRFESGALHKNFKKRINNQY